MKKILALCLIFFFLFNASAFALSNYQISSNMTFLNHRNEFRLDYWGYPNTATSLYVSFTNSAGQMWNNTYDSSALTGIFYLTCSGTYVLHFNNSSGGTVASITDIGTSDINNGSCSSYAGGTIKNDLGLTSTKNTDGSFTLDWNSLGATNYDVYKDGSLINNTTGTTTNVNGDGSYNVRAKDSSGNIIGESDVSIRNGTSTAGNGSGGGTGTTCNGCDWIKTALTCPEWDTYMGEFTDAIAAALPPPPNWDEIADKIGAATINHLKEYYGPVPAAPTQAEIDAELDKPLPPIDATAPDAGKLIPTVPAGYEQPKPFDITTGPQINVVDESQPFQIFDPLHNIEYDLPGVPVIPGDPRNNTGGIQQPTPITLPTPTPTPSTMPPLPENPVPIPSSSPGPGPVPSSGGSSSGPTPQWKGG